MGTNKRYSLGPMGALFFPAFLCLFLTLCGYEPTATDSHRHSVFHNPQSDLRIPHSAIISPKLQVLFLDALQLQLRELLL